jgi:hypothetical protein
MIITYLLAETSPSPRTRCVLAHADAMVVRGYLVRLATTDDPVTWRTARAEWTYVDSLTRAEGDVFVATSPQTAQIAYDLAPTHAVQLVFGDAAALPIAKLATGPIVDDDVFRPRTPRENDPLRVLLSGAWQNEPAGVDDGYGAIAHARWFHQKLELVRVAPWAPSREEPLDSVQEFHVGLSTAEAMRVLHSCDVVVAPMRHDAPVGLDAAMALAAGIPVVATSIDAHHFDGQLDFAAFGPENNPVELGERLIDLLSDQPFRDRLRIRGREVAEQFRPARATAAAEVVFAALAARLPVR